MKQKYYVELNRQEWRLIIEGLNRFRNKLIAAGRYTEAVHAVVPDVIHQLLLTHGPPLMHHQIFQNTRLLAGQSQGLPVDGGGAGAGVEAQVSAA